MNKPVQFKTAAILGVRSMLGSAIAAELEREAVSTIAVGRSQKDDIFVDLSLFGLFAKFHIFILIFLETNEVYSIFPFYF